MIDFDALLELPKLLKLEYLLLLCAFTTTQIGYVHQLLCLNRFNVINTQEELNRYAWFVRAQMLSTLMMFIFLVPAILIGAFNGAENFLMALTVYALIFANGKLFGRLESSFKVIRSDHAEIQTQVDLMIYQWEEKAIPTF